MGELLARFRRLPTAGLELDDRWADPGRLAAEAGRWSRGSPGWQPFLRGAGIDATDPELPVRVRCLQVLRMVELLAGETRLAPEVRGIIADRLRSMLRQRGCTEVVTLGWEAKRVERRVGAMRRPEP